MKNFIKATETDRIIGFIGDKKYLIETISRRECIHHCLGKGFSGTDEQGYIIPCKCLGEVIIIRRLVHKNNSSDEIILGKTLQEMKRKRKRIPKPKRKRRLSPS